ncbi:ABC transporter permease [Kribbella sp. NPDC051620]|uniref:ABC transporter permease n=1 Tax=Kribbella sp. NPDC051620 TaxID=3364120 RepID=UPI00378D7DCB
MARDQRPGGATPRSGRRWIRYQYQRREKMLLGTLSLLLVLVAWQVAADLELVKQSFASSPRLIWTSLLDYFSPGGSGWTDLRASGQEFVYGFVISVLIGIPVGILMGWYRRLDALLNPIVLLLNNSPRIAIAPLFVIWFGIGLASKVWVVVLSAIVPIIVNARAGVVTIEPSLIAMSRSYGSSDFRLLRTVILPGSVPAISSGIRLGIGYALLGVVLAEFIASTEGLGFVVTNSAATFNTDRLFVAVVVISTLGMVANALLSRVEKYFDRWRTA